MEKGVHVRFNRLQGLCSSLFANSHKQPVAYRLTHIRTILNPHGGFSMCEGMVLVVFMPDVVIAACAMWQVALPCSIFHVTQHVVASLVSHANKQRCLVWHSPCCRRRCPTSPATSASQRLSIRSSANKASVTESQWSKDSLMVMVLTPAVKLLRSVSRNDLRCAMMRTFLCPQQHPTNLTHACQQVS